MVEVRVVDVIKRYRDNYALKKVSIRVPRGNLVCILGPSGSGKTTLLRIIAGLIKPDEGRVYFDDSDVTDLPPWRRNVGYVFQNIALFPHMNVYDNIAFGLKLRKLSREEIARRVREALKLVRLDGYEKRKPSELSGGEAQRIALARALVIDPAVLLFDEALGQLDAKLREELKFEIRRIQKETGKTAIYVTHDQSEAFAIADYIYVINKGEIEQGGTPIELYEEPRSPFIAEFIGSTNFIKGVVTELYGDYHARISAGGVDVLVKARGDLRVGDSVLVGVRSEEIYVAKSREALSTRNIYEGSLVRKIFVGPTLRLEVDIGYNEPLKVDIYGEEKHRFLNCAAGERLYVGFDKASVFKTK